jgi:hypothetical protein
MDSTATRPQEPTKKVLKDIELWIDQFQMAGARGNWDADAGSSVWLQPGERIFWRGRPDPRVVFSKEDRYIVPITLFWAVFGTIWVHFAVAQAPTRFRLFVTALGYLGAFYLVTGRLIARAWDRPRTWYTITDRRAVEIKKHGRSVREATPSASVVRIEHRADGRHGTMIFETNGRSSTEGYRNPFVSSLAQFPASAYRGTGLPWAVSRFEMAFVDVDGIHDLMSSARAAGFKLPDSIRSKNSHAARLPSGNRGDSYPNYGRFGLSLVSKWLARYPYQLKTRLSPYEVADRLAWNLGPIRSRWNSFTTSARFQGTVSGWSVRMTCEGRSRNSGAWVFEGGISVSEEETWLSGKVGPPSYAAIFALIWCSCVSIFLLGGTTGFLVDVATGHGYRLAALSLFPAGMLVLFFVVMEVTWRRVRDDWDQMDRWLRQLLEAVD